MKKTILFILLVLTAGLAAYECNFNLPLLVVHGDKGNVTEVPFSFHSKKNAIPLRVTISDNSPNGSGNSIRSSIWQAAITAAMLRKNLMNGTRIGVEFSGRVDGPSAGAMVCLAILSAMDERPFPNDFAMTGTIMPDGTVGLVGGVALKMRAAAKHGIKRICIPSFLRFEKQEDKTSVDLFREAKKLGMTVYPVEHILEAYSILHCQEPEARSVLDPKKICKLSEETENELIRQYQKYLPIVQKNWAGLSKEEQEQIKDTFGYDMLTSETAERMFEAGKLYNAAGKIYANYLFWEARKQNMQIAEEMKKNNSPIWQKLSSGSKKHIIEGLVEYDQATAEIKKELKKHLSGANHYFPDKPEMKDISAQLEPVLDMWSLFGEVDWADAQYGINEKNKKELEKRKDEEFKEAAAGLAFITDLKLLSLLAGIIMTEKEGDFRIPLAMTMPQINANANAAMVENLFYSGWLAVNNTFTNDVIHELAEGAQCTPAQVKNYLCSEDMNCSIYENCISGFMLYHSLLEKNKQSYHTIATTFAAVDLFSQASTLLVKYGPELGAEKDEEGNVVYKNPDFLNYLIRTAREQALRSIAECRRLNIPCLSPIGIFEQAEYQREKNDSDKVHDVLEQYWEAGLQAKALVLSFQ